MAVLKGGRLERFYCIWFDDLIWFQRTKYLHDWNQFMKSHTFHHDLRAWVTFSNRLLNRPLIGLLGHFLIKRTKDFKQINTIFQSYITICKVSPPFWHLCPLFSTSSVLCSNNFDTFVGYPVICYYNHPILSLYLLCILFTLGYINFPWLYLPYESHYIEVLLEVIRDLLGCWMFRLLGYLFVRLFEVLTLQG